MNIEQVTAEEAMRRLPDHRQDLVSGPGACWLLSIDGHARGALQLEILSFDSELFGATMARMTVFEAPSAEGYAALLAAAQAECRRRRIAHVVRRLPVGAYAEVWALGAADYRLVDVSVLFERRSDAPPFSDPELRLAGPDDADHLADKFARTFTLTRFAVDPFCSEEAAAELHRRWIRNSCRGRADAVFVADRGGEIDGFVTCRLDRQHATGNVELIGVDAARRGAGVGRRLMASALDWFRERCDLVQVRTQLNNSRAFSLYQAHGFRLKLGELTYSHVTRLENNGV